MSLDFHNIFVYNRYTGSLYWKYTISNKAIEGHIAGTLKQTGYIEIQYNKKRYYAHRIIYEMHVGIIPEGFVVDHINKNRSDNRLKNLRCVPHYINLHNQRVSKRNTSKAIGIHWAKDKQKWVAKKTIKGKLVFYKYYDDFELAKKDLAFFSEFLMDPQVKQLCITRYV